MKADDQILPSYIYTYMPMQCNAMHIHHRRKEIFAIHSDKYAHITLGSEKTYTSTKLQKKNLLIAISSILTDEKTSHSPLLSVHPIYPFTTGRTPLINDKGSILRKSGVPYPETGSHPVVAFQLAYGTNGVPKPLKVSVPVHPVDPP